MANPEPVLQQIEASRARMDKAENEVAGTVVYNWIVREELNKIILAKCAYDAQVAKEEADLNAALDDNPW